MKFSYQFKLPARADRKRSNTRRARAIARKIQRTIKLAALFQPETKAAANATH